MSLSYAFSASYFLPSAFRFPLSAFRFPPSAFCLLPSAVRLLPSALCLLLLTSACSQPTPESGQQQMPPRHRVPASGWLFPSFSTRRAIERVFQSPVPTLLPLDPSAKSFSPHHSLPALQRSFAGDRPQPAERES